MRVTRLAESHWHIFSNIKDSQKGLFTLEVVIGMNHQDAVSDLNKDQIPQYIKDHDLSSLITLEYA
jgi:hypothetical protein